MMLQRSLVSRFYDFGRPAQTFDDTAILCRICFDLFRVSQPFILVTGQGLPTGPRDSKKSCGLYRLFFTFCDDAKKIPLTNDLDHAGNTPHRTLINTHQSRSNGRRENHSSMNHPGKPDVVHVRPGCGDLRGNIDARNGLADDLEVGLLEWSCTFQSYPAIVARVGRFQPRIEEFVSDKFAIGYFLRCVSLNADDSVLHGQAVCGHIQPRCRLVHQYSSRLSSSPDKGLAAASGIGAGGAFSAIRRKSRITHDDTDWF